MNGLYFRTGPLFVDRTSLFSVNTKASLTNPAVTAVIFPTLVFSQVFTCLFVIYKISVKELFV